MFRSLCLGVQKFMIVYFWNLGVCVCLFRSSGVHYCLLRSSGVYVCCLRFQEFVFVCLGVQELCFFFRSSGDWSTLPGGARHPRDGGHSGPRHVR